MSSDALTELPAIYASPPDVSEIVPRSPIFIYFGTAETSCVGIEITPRTSSIAPGAVVPMPTLPS